MLAEEERAEALETLADVVEWRLPVERWDHVADIVETLAQAFAYGDMAGFRDGVIDLEMVGPVRVTRIGTTPSVPPPERVRDRVNHLVHSLGVEGNDRNEGNGDVPDTD